MDVDCVWQLARREIDACGTRAGRTVAGKVVVAAGGALIEGYGNK